MCTSIDSPSFLWHKTRLEIVNCMTGGKSISDAIRAHHQNQQILEITKKCSTNLQRVSISLIFKMNELLSYEWKKYKKCYADIAYLSAHWFRQR